MTLLIGWAVVGVPSKQKYRETERQCSANPNHWVPATGNFCPTCGAHVVVNSTTTAVEFTMGSTYESEWEIGLSEEDREFFKVHAYPLDRDTEGFFVEPSHEVAINYGNFSCKVADLPKIEPPDQELVDKLVAIMRYSSYTLEYMIYVE